jgi:hypothetical protein
MRGDRRNRIPCARLEVFRLIRATAAGLRPADSRKPALSEVEGAAVPKYALTPCLRW